MRKRNFKAFRSGPLNPTEDGKRMLALGLNESYMMAWRDQRRPSDAAHVKVQGKRFHLEPTEAGLKVTRVK